jgi:hypothetical protein
MIWVPAMIIGAVSGAVFARKRGGRGADMAQYGAAWAIGLGLLAVAVSIIIDRLTH